MSETSFKFRQFTVHQEKCAMKVGTDAVLLGSWIKPEYARRILDIGSGTGIISLMIAQKSSGEIDAIDIDENAFLQTKENFRISPWFYRLHPHHTSLQDFASDRKPVYDLIVTNPPYFHHASKPNEEARIHARHNDFLSFDELIEGAKSLLLPDGKFCVILPCKEGKEFMDKAMKKNLFCKTLLKIKTKSDRSEKRVIMEFTFNLEPVTETEISIHEEDGSFTQQYIDLTSEYYINLKSGISDSK